MRKLLIATLGNGDTNLPIILIFTRGGNPKAAIDCCVIQNRWDLALQLAEEHDFPQVEGLLTRYAQNLLLKGKKLEAVELYRRANRPTDSAILLGDIAEQVPSFRCLLHFISSSTRLQGKMFTPL